MTRTNAGVVWGESRAEAWLNAAKYLMDCDGWEALNLILEVRKPSTGTKRSKEIESKVDSFLVSQGMQPLETVAETLFPAAEYRRMRTAEAVYDHYPNHVYPHIKKGWGTYAYRILRRRDEHGEIFNPLKDCIKKISSGNQRAAYEIEVSDSEFDIHTYDSRRAVDRNSPIGTPCLSHLSFKVLAGHLYVTGIYRHHYYVERALGNLRGLAQLQRFMCDQTGLQPGSVTCLSTLAKLEFNGRAAKMAQLEELIGVLNEI